MYESWGVAMQLLQDGRGVNPDPLSCMREDGTSCPDWTYGGAVCCSPKRCEIVALEPAIFTPLDMNNLATGGVMLKHAGYPGSDNDFLPCPAQAPGLPRLRTFELSMTCDPSGSSSDLAILSYNEGDDGEDGQYCRFQVNVSTRAACGVPDPIPSPPGPSANDIAIGLVASGDLVTRGGQFGYAILGGLLTLALQYAYEHRHRLLHAAQKAGLPVPTTLLLAPKAAAEETSLLRSRSYGTVLTVLPGSGEPL